MQPYLDGSHSDAERLSRLVDTHLLDIAKHKNFAIDQWQVGDRMLQKLLHFLALQRLGWYLAPVPEQRGRGVALTVRRFVQRLHLDVFLATKTASSLVEGDAYQPCTELCVAAESSEVPKGFEEGFLRGVFSVGFIVEQRLRHNVHASLVRANEVVKLMRIAGKDRGDDLRLVPAFNSSSHCFSIHGDSILPKTARTGDADHFSIHQV